MAEHQQKTGAEVLEESEDDSAAAVKAGSRGAMTGQMMSTGRGAWQSAEGLGGTLAAGDVLEDALKQDQVSVKRTDQHAAARVIPSRGGLAKAIGSSRLGPGLPDDPGPALADSDLTGTAGTGDRLAQTLDDDDVVAVDTSQGEIHAERPGENDTAARGARGR